MGKRKRGAVARTESAKSVMKAYWEKKRAAGVATPASTPLASHHSAVGVEVRAAGGGD